ncbi:DUF3006 family protein [bacterium]|nr:DUF3006 family protein [bacterium]
MITGIVDQVNNQVVLVVIDNFGSIELPRKAFPAGIREGEAIRIEITIDQQATERRQADIASIQDRLRKRT